MMTWWTYDDSELKQKNKHHTAVKNKREHESSSSSPAGWVPVSLGRRDFLSRTPCLRKGGVFVQTAL